MVGAVMLWRCWVLADMLGWSSRCAVDGGVGRRVEAHCGGASWFHWKFCNVGRGRGCGLLRCGEGSCWRLVVAAFGRMASSTLKEARMEAKAMALVGRSVGDAVAEVVRRLTKALQRVVERRRGGLRVVSGTTVGLPVIMVRRWTSVAT